jgi:hypothetical protein
MRKRTDKLSDPVDDITNDSAAGDDELKGLDPNAQPSDTEEQVGVLSADEIGAIHERRTSSPHPFDGYQLGRNIIVGQAEISATFLVLLKPSEEPQPDKSNENQTIYTGPPGQGGTPQTGRAKTVTLPTSHTRVVSNRQGNQNETVVFDREVVLAHGQTFKCAIIRSHTSRAQVCFEYDTKSKRVRPDKRYMLADTRQAIPLRKLFEAVYYQRTGAERAAREFDAAQETTAADRPLT